MARLAVCALLALCGRMAGAARRGASRPPPCPYTELGVTKTASDDEIKKAYKAAALKLHPDKAPPNKRQSYEARFKRVNAAYQKVRDADARQKHARESRTPNSPFARPAPPAGDSKKRAPPPAAEDDKPPRRPREKKKPCFGGTSVETLEAVESRFLGATLPAQ